MCFSMDWLLHILILGVIICAVVAILKIVIPYALGKMGATIGEGAGIVIACFRVLLWAVIVIFVLIICFQIIACLLSMGGGGSLIPHMH